MNTERIRIEHSATPFFKRVRYYIIIYIIIVCFIVLAGILKVDSKKVFPIVILISLSFAIPILFKIRKTKLYISDFYSDSQKVTVRYFDGFHEKTIESVLEKTEAKLENTATGRGGFNCELQLKIETINFVIDNDFDWDIYEMRKLFEYIQFQKNITLTRGDKFIISRIENKLKKKSISEKH